MIIEKVNVYFLKKENLEWMEGFVNEDVVVFVFWMGKIGLVDNLKGDGCCYFVLV